MPESLGARLRRQREQRQIPLSVIAEQTKIAIWLLQGLEADDLSRWPTGIFRRAFVRTYASAIGLEPEVVVREFQEIHPDPAEMVTIPWDGAAVSFPGFDGNAVPPSRFRLLVGAALGSLGRRQSNGNHDASDGFSDPTAAVHRAAPATETLHADVAIASDPSRQVSTAWNPDVSAAAQLCTDFGRVDDVQELMALLARAAHILGATGLIVWVRDSETSRLWPVLAHGYTEKVLAQVLPLRCDDDNATATAFRTAQTSIVKSSSAASGAMVVPLMAHTGCAGVLAIEFHGGTEQNQLVRALATIFAALLAPLLGDARSSVERERKLG